VRAVFVRRRHRPAVLGLAGLRPQVASFGQRALTNPLTEQISK
jgi:hypothetical protein